MCDFECGKTPSKMAARIQNRASPNPLPAQDVDHEQYQGLSGALAQANVKPNCPEPAVRGGWKLYLVEIEYIECKNALIEQWHLVGNLYI